MLAPKKILLMLLAITALSGPAKADNLDNWIKILSKKPDNILSAGYDNKHNLKADANLNFGNLNPYVFLTISYMLEH